MPPAKSSAKNLEDHKSEPMTSKGSASGSAKMRRGASQSSHNQARELPVAPTSAPSQAPVEAILPTLANLPAVAQLPWASFDREVLHAYRREHNLETPKSFTSTYHKLLMSQPAGIGMYSPTMVRKKALRRQPKDRLALAVRKHFNGVGIQENDVIVDFICKVRNGKSANPTAPARQDPSTAETL
ncbi:hypothetical protein Golomagni_07239 [Golovinomyces magnicellulatus]|nr:hypothetical protein Golomagni_07239 [Golovinomyces magnicellulatus]